MAVLTTSPSCKKGIEERGAPPYVAENAPTIASPEATRGPLVFIERLDRHHKPNGWVELPVTGVWEVHDGRITLWRECFDAGTLPKQKV